MSCSFGGTLGVSPGISAAMATGGRGNVSLTRRLSMDSYMVRIYTGSLNLEHEFTSVEAEKITTAEEVVRTAVRKLRLDRPEDYELSEVMSTAGQLCKERCLEDSENPVRIQLLWPKIVNAEIDRGQGLLTGYRFYLRKKNLENVNRTVSWNVYSDPNPVDSFLTQFLMTRNKEYSDLCNLPDLNERTLLENIKSRFHNSNIYTYVGSILIAVNPFKFFPIYNPKYVKMYQNKRLGDLPPHVFAIADAAFHTMLRGKKNQCIVISGESGSGKTESTNLLLHHLTALSHKGLHGSGVEQTILGAGPVLEAFGNAKTVHNNNSSRFGKFIQVNYKENGMVHGAIVEKYLLEKSRIVSQAKNERNYHVFYYLLEGADDLERQKLHLGKPEDYHYLNQSDCFNVDEVDEANEFSRLKQSMEMVGFSQVTQKRIFGVLSAVLHLGNVKFRKKGDQHHDESVTIQNMETLTIISQVLKVKERTLVEALTQKKATAGDETVVMNHRMEDAVATRDAMAKCLYGALFDWIVLKVNQALLAKRHNSEHQGNAIGVLDIFGFEDFSKNSFEQFCINYANEHLQYYFNQHIFKFEQEEYKKEGIQWKNIEFIDNTGCLELFSKKTVGLFSLLDEECNFPAATNDTLLYKFHDHHSKGPSVYYEATKRKEMAFTVVHYAGRVKYNIKDFREKNSDQIRTDIVGNLKSSSLSFVRELMGVDPVAVLRWTIVKTLIKSMFAFIKAGKKYRQRGGPEQSVLLRRKQSSTDYLNIPDLGSGHFISSRRSRHSDWSPRSPLHDNPSYSARSSRAADGDHDDEVFIVKSPRNSVKSPVDLHLSEDEVIVMREAERVMLKNKSFKPKSRPQTMFSDIKTLKAIASRTMYSGGKVNTKQKPPSVGAQFQWSLSRLMGTLNKANPFFIRCIKSNAYKEACLFDDVLVLRQLRYTGMLATVRIRQSGYNYRLTFEEFVMMYKILLPKGLLSGEGDVCAFLETMNMDQDNYQIGKTKVFLREGEKLCLDNALHCAIMERVIFIQRLVKTKVERKNFVHLRQQVVVIQKYIRRFLAQRKVGQMRECALMIQRWYRGTRQKRRYCLTRHSAIRIQAHMKGHLCRKRYQQKKVEFYKRKEEQEVMRQLAEEEEVRRRAEEEAAKHLDKHLEDMHSSNSDEGVLIKDNSADELDVPRLQRMDSEESSGILDDSESDTLSEAKGSHGSMVSPTATPTGPAIQVEGLTPNKDEYLSQARQSSRVSGLSRVFQSREGRSFEDEVDGGSSPGVIFIRRGSARKRGTPKMSPAPLAKQESFSDLESPPEKVSPLTPDRLQLIDDTLKRPRVPEHLQLAQDETRSKSPLKVLKGLVAPVALRETKSFPTGDEGSATLRRKLSVSTSTLIRRTKSSIKMLRDFKSSKERKKKDSCTEDSDEDDTELPMGRRPQNIGGVIVLPRHPGPKSPLSDKAPVFSGDDAKPEDDKQIKKKRVSRKNKEGEKEWIVAKMSQWQYPDDWVITDTIELQLLDEFIGRKINGWLKDTGSKLSQFDRVFTRCLKSFHQELKSTLSIAMRGPGNTCNTKYRELFANFGVTMEATCREEKVDSEFPVTMCLNSFRGFLDEFRNSVNAKKKDHKLKKKQNRPKQGRGKTKKDVVEHQGHKFSPSQFGIPTFCELCSTIMWIMEKGYVCQVCKYTCHRKCIQRSSTPCKGIHDAYNQKNAGTKVFGIPLQSLVGKEETIPVLVEKLIRQIETTGLYTVGIYRKPGTTHGIRSLKGQMDLGKIDVNLEDYPIHVLTSTLKSFFRELPEPLLTFELYDEFIQAAEIQDEKEAIQGLYSLTGRLPKVNHDVFERLIFHLARVANHEKSNKMSVNALAIIFAPCLLRTNQELQAQESLVQVSRQQVCIDKILQEQLRKMETTLSDIKLLETAEETAQQRLSVVRASMKNNKSPVPKGTTAPPTSVTEEEDSEDSELLQEQARVISSHIKSLRNEKDGLTSALPVLDYRHSSDDEMLSMEDVESTYDTADDMDFDESGNSFDMPASPPQEPTHLMKEPASTPNRRPPSRHNQLSEDDDSSFSNPTTRNDHPTGHDDPQPGDQPTTDHDHTVTLRNRSHHDTQPQPECDIAEFNNNNNNSADTREYEEDFIYRHKRTFKYLIDADFSTSTTSIDSTKQADTETDAKTDTSGTVAETDSKHVEFEKEHKTIGISVTPEKESTAQHGTKRKNVDKKVHLNIGTERARHPLIKSASAEELKSEPSGFGLSVQLVGSSNTDGPRKPRKLQRAAHVTHSPLYSGTVGETLGETMKTITLPLIPSLVTEGRDKLRGRATGMSGSLKSRSPLRSQPINVDQKSGGRTNRGHHQQQHHAEARLHMPLSRQSSDTSVKSQNTTPGSSPRSQGSDSALLAMSPAQSAGLVLLPPAAGRITSHDNVGLPVTELEHESEDEIMV